MIKENPKSNPKSDPKMTTTEKARLSYADIQKMCTDFMNDPDTIIALENYWSDWMITTIDLDYSREEIMCALNVTTSDLPVEVPVIWIHYEEYDDWTTYVAIYDRKIEISTHARLLYSKAY